MYIPSSSSSRSTSELFSRYTNCPPNSMYVRERQKVDQKREEREEGGGVVMAQRD